MKTDGKTTPELVAMRQAIENNPDSRESGGLYLFSRMARRKFDAIDRAIAANMAEAREKAGSPVSCDGYSGRQTNRR